MKKPPLEHAFGLIVAPKKKGAPPEGSDEEEAGESPDEEAAEDDYGDEAEHEACKEAFAAIKDGDEAAFGKALSTLVHSIMEKKMSESEGE